MTDKKDKDLSEEDASEEYEQEYEDFGPCRAGLWAPDEIDTPIRNQCQCPSCGASGLILGFYLQNCLFMSQHLFQPSPASYPDAEEPCYENAVEALLRCGPFTEIDVLSHIANAWGEGVGMKKELDRVFGR